MIGVQKNNKNKWLGIFFFFFFNTLKKYIVSWEIVGILIIHLSFLTFHEEERCHLQENKMKFKNLGWLPETLPLWEINIKLWNGLLREIVKVIIQNIKN